MRRLVSALGFVVLLSSTLVGAAAAGAPSRGVEPPGRMLGMIPVAGQARGGGRPQPQSNNLIDHGGPVMGAGNRTYAIYWGEPGSWESGYTDTISRYFTDVAADVSTTTTTNVYYSDTQYSSIDNDSTFGGAIFDTSPYPANGCTDKATRTCLSDAQLRTELQLVMSTHGLAAASNGVRNLFFIFTPKGVGSCYGSSCAYTNFCAYHSWIPQSGSAAILYANQPYAAQSYRIYTCDSGQHPNGNAADATLNVASHEHNEAITDPEGSAWYDNQGYENGDKCAWNFGTALGTVNGAKYNQVINENDYYLQQEWSNQRSGCVLTGL
jgi:hypothetical protein